LHSSTKYFDGHKNIGWKEKEGQKDSPNEWDMELEGSKVVMEK